jgi:hypothetical protein
MGRTEGMKIDLWFSLFMVLLLPGLVQAAPPPLTPPQKVIQDKDCFECHKDEKLKYVTPEGAFVSLWVNEKEWADDIHHKKGVKCVDCHVNVDSKTHSLSGYPKVDCTRECHLKDVKGFTSHKKNLEESRKSFHPVGVPLKNGRIVYCADCHTKHTLFPRIDPRSSLNSINAQVTCDQCHDEGKGITGFINRVVKFRLNSHEKTDFSQRFEESMCIDCHYRESRHSKRSQDKQYCNRCHTMEKGTKIFFSPIHLKASFTEQPVTFLMKIFYLFLIVAIVAGFIVYAGIIVLRKIKDESWRKRMTDKFIIPDEVPPAKEQ